MFRPATTGADTVQSQAKYIYGEEPTIQYYPAASYLQILPATSLPLAKTVYESENWPLCKLLDHTLEAFACPPRMNFNSLPELKPGVAPTLAECQTGPTRSDK